MSLSELGSYPLPTADEPNLVAVQGVGHFTQGDAVTAQELLQGTWQTRADRPVKTCIFEIYAALARRERALPKVVRDERPRKWTERRVRAIWHLEARRIDAYEMIDLEIIAAGEALNELTTSIDRADRMATFLAARGKSFNGAALDRLREFHRRARGTGVV